MDRALAEGGVYPNQAWRGRTHVTCRQNAHLAAIAVGGEIDADYTVFKMNRFST